MTQVQQIVRDALGHLRIIDADEPLKAIDLQDGIRTLNMMMRRIEADGLSLGWNDVVKGDDELPLPAEAEEAIGYMLAVRLRPRYGVQIDGDVIAMAELGIAALRRDRLVSAPLEMCPRRLKYNIRTASYFW